MRTARKQQCSRVLRNTFGVSGFRPGQEQAADALLDGRDLLCILPTGAGKSLCWQLPALMMDGLTIVISPLIVLMHDQVRHLRERGIPSVHLDSLMTPAERADALSQLTRGQAKIAFLAPERLNHPEIYALCRQHPPAMVVVPITLSVSPLPSASSSRSNTEPAANVALPPTLIAPTELPGAKVPARIRSPPILPMPDRRAPLAISALPVTVPSSRTVALPVANRSPPIRPGAPMVAVPAPTVTSPATP